MWGESKLAKMALSGSLIPCFVKNDYERAEIIYRTMHAHHELLACSWVTVCASLYGLLLRKWWHYCYVTAVFIGSVTRGENTACLLLQLLSQPGENTVMAAVSARREVVLC